jgi:hypothetical protein
MFDMPFLIGDREDVARMLDGEVGVALRASMREAAGLEVLAFGELGSARSPTMFARWRCRLISKVSVCVFQAVRPAS